MAISNVNRVKSIVISLQAGNSDIIPIYQNDGGLTLGKDFLAGYTIISFNCFVKNLKAFASVQSLPEVKLPDFKLEDSETDKLYKTIDVEWKSARKQLNLYISNTQITNNQTKEGWSQVGSLSILNPSGYPFRVYNLMDLYTDNLAFELGDNSKIGIGVENVGFGLLDTTDKITIHGSYVEEIFLHSQDTVYSIAPAPLPSTSTSSPSSSSTQTQGSLSWSEISSNDWLQMTTENWQNIK